MYCCCSQKNMYIYLLKKNCHFYWHFEYNQKKSKKKKKNQRKKNERSHHLNPNTTGNCLKHTKTIPNIFMNPGQCLVLVNVLSYDKLSNKQ